MRRALRSCVAVDFSLPRAANGANHRSVEQALDFVQWPAMLATLVAAYLVASQQRQQRRWGFWCFIASNVLWVVWGWHRDAPALILLQVGLFLLNLRGAEKND